MPFKSQNQRALFNAAKNDPAIRKLHGLNLSVIKRFLEEDRGGKLPSKKRKRPSVSQATRRAVARGRKPSN